MLTGLFGLSESLRVNMHCTTDGSKDRSLKNIPLLGVPASLAFGYGLLKKMKSLEADQCTGSGLFT